MSDVVVRRASGEDAATIGALNKHVQEWHREGEPQTFQAWDHISATAFFEEQLAQSDCALFVAELDGEAVGYLWARSSNAGNDALRLSSPALIVEQIAVEPGTRRRGVGRALMAEAEAEARTKGLNRLELDYWSFNSSAEAFFADLGFHTFNVRARRLLSD